MLKDGLHYATDEDGEKNYFELDDGCFACMASYTGAYENYKVLVPYLPCKYGGYENALDMKYTRKRAKEVRYY